MPKLMPFLKFTIHKWVYISSILTKWGISIDTSCINAWLSLARFFTSLHNSDLQPGTVIVCTEMKRSDESAMESEIDHPDFSTGQLDTTRINFQLIGSRTKLAKKSSFLSSPLVTFWCKCHLMKHWFARCASTNIADVNTHTHTHTKIK